MARMLSVTNEHEGNGTGAGVPAVVSTILRLGVPAAIALYLVYFLTERIERRQGELFDSMTAHIQQMQQDASERSRSEALLRLIMRQTCRNTARTQMDRAGCEDYGAR